MNAPRVTAEPEGFRDPHVFPYVVKGFKEPNEVKYESRRSLVEAQQTQERFEAGGYMTWVFELRLAGEGDAQ